MTYHSALDFLNSLINYEQQPKLRNQFKLDNIRRLLKLAGDPQARMKNIILIAGTKGKGSVSYMIEAGLRACGFSTGLFISPHLTTVRERIQLQGAPIPKPVFTNLIKRFQPLVQKQRVSYFELLTAMAFELFAQRKVDYAVIEVGLGGRLDATNLSHPQISVITRIGYDHIQVLGNSLTKIAREKAGIMRPGKPVVIGQQPAEAKNELQNQVEKTGAIPFWVEDHSRVWDEAISPIAAPVPHPYSPTLTFSCFTELGAGRVELNLLGRHQIENCIIALTTLGLIARSEPKITFESVISSFRQLTLPGRCQLIKTTPPIIIDSCHNPDSGLALANLLREYLKDRVILIYGSLRGKLVTKTLSHIAPYTEIALVVPPNSPRALTPSILKGLFRRFGVPSETYPKLSLAITRAKELALGKLPIVIAGSFYLAGEALALLQKELTNNKSGLC